MTELSSRSEPRLEAESIWGACKIGLRILVREARSGTRGLVVLMLCVALSTAAYSTVSALIADVEFTIRTDGQKIIDGDAAIEVTHRQFNADERSWLETNAQRFSETATLRSNLINPVDGDAVLVDLKAVDGFYPLFAELSLEPALDLEAALAPRPNPSDDPSLNTGTLNTGTKRYGAVAERALIDRLRLRADPEQGSVLKLGAIELMLTAEITRETDRGLAGVQLGPRLLISLQALDDSKLILPGSLAYWRYSVQQLPGQTLNQLESAAQPYVDEGGWQFTRADRAGGDTEEFLFRLALFMTQVGLISILAGGIGVANATRAWTERRRSQYALWKCLGAGVALVRGIALAQIMIWAFLAAVLGSFLGAVAPLIVRQFDLLPFELYGNFYPRSIMLSIFIGLLATALFALPAIFDAAASRPARLLRGGAGQSKIGSALVLWMGACMMALAMIAITSSPEPAAAPIFMAGWIAVILILVVVARLFTRLISSFKPRYPVLRMALRRLDGTSGLFLSLGIGLTMLTALSLTQNSLNRLFEDTVREDAPNFFFVDIQPQQLDRFVALAEDFDSVSRVDTAPMLRGRITHFDDIPVTEHPDNNEQNDSDWVLESDRGLTWARQPPSSGSLVTQGEWWDQDYQGEPLISLDADIARDFNLVIGDSITVDLLGRQFRAIIANLREIDWRGFEMNFVMIFSPGLIQSAPQTHLAVVYLDVEDEVALRRTVAENFPNISGVRVRDVIEQIRDVLRKMSLAIGAIGTVAIAIGILVLAAASIAEQRRRAYMTVLLKVVGATRGQIIAVFLAEFAAIGAVASFLAIMMGMGVSYLLCRFALNIDLVPGLGAVVVPLMVGLAVSLGVGVASSLPLLNQRPLSWLRNQ